MFTEVYLPYIIVSAIGIAILLSAYFFRLGRKTGIKLVLELLSIEDAVHGVPLWENAEGFLDDYRKGLYPSNKYCRITLPRENRSPHTLNIIGTNFALYNTDPIPPGINGGEGYSIISTVDLRELLFAAGVKRKPMREKNNAPALVCKTYDPSDDDFAVCTTR